MSVNSTARAPFHWVGVSENPGDAPTYWGTLSASAETLRAIEDIFDQPTLHFAFYDAQRDACMFMALDAEGYRRTSFLDRFRAAPYARDKALLVGVPRTDLLHRALPLALKSHFIFHTGHCGSTLLSRALGALTESLALREPPVLSWAAEALRNDASALETTARIELSATLIARRFVSAAPTIVKATSWTSNLAPRLLARTPEARAVCLYQPLAEHVISLFAYTSNDVLRAAQTARIDLGLEASEDAPAELIALGWMGRIWSMHALADQLGQRVCFLSRDELQTAPEASLRRVLTHFEIEPRSGPLLAPEVWQWNAKAMTEPYNAAAKREARAGARAQLAAEIAAAERYVQQLCERRPELHAAIERVSRADCVSA
jgi:hypothetical protein